jgi:hypothetical protein
MDVLILDWNHGLYPLTKMRKVMDGGENTENGIIGICYFVPTKQILAPCMAV